MELSRFPGKRDKRDTTKQGNYDPRCMTGCSYVIDTRLTTGACGFISLSKPRPVFFREASSLILESRLRLFGRFLTAFEVDDFEEGLRDRIHPLPKQFSLRRFIPLSNPNGPHQKCAIPFLSSSKIFADDRRGIQLDKISDARYI